MCLQFLLLLASSSSLLAHSLLLWAQQRVRPVRDRHNRRSEQDQLGKVA